jgi:hypothetical protein
VKDGKLYAKFQPFLRFWEDPDAPQGAGGIPPMGFQPFLRFWLQLAPRHQQQLLRLLPVSTLLEILAFVERWREKWYIRYALVSTLLEILERLHCQVYLGVVVVSTLLEILGRGAGGGGGPRKRSFNPS